MAYVTLEVISVTVVTVLPVVESLLDSFSGSPDTGN
jgi:hypothetical protein